MRGINDDEVSDFARLTFDHPWHVRFIELMPVGEMRELTWDHVVPTDEILRNLEAVGDLETTAGPERGNGPARYYRFADAAGTIGVITPDVAHLLRELQPRKTYRGRPPSHLSLRRR